MESPGLPYRRAPLYKLFDRYARMAGVDSAAFPHMARATMITAAFAAGCSGEDIQRTVGHSSITTTEGYNHTAQKHRQSASLKIGVLGSANPIPVRLSPNFAEQNLYIRREMGPEVSRNFFLFRPSGPVSLPFHMPWFHIEVYLLGCTANIQNAANTAALTEFLIFATLILP